MKEVLLSAKRVCKHFPQDAVENNPVLEGWGNKIISISDGD